MEGAALLASRGAHTPARGLQNGLPPIMRGADQDVINAFTPILSLDQSAANETCLNQVRARERESTPVQQQLDRL